MEAEKLQKEQGTEEVKSKVLSFTEDPLKLTLFLVLVPVRAHVPCVCMIRCCFLFQWLCAAQRA